MRVAKGLGLYLDSDTESFFDQQMRRRLWFTICLMDLQASFFQASEPLISVDESTSSALPQHINDLDFDISTMHPLPDREGLTDSTFALVTYHAQRMGRLLNFSAQAGEADLCGQSGTSSLISTGPGRYQQQQARDFEKEALQLLHFCDPESSPYAWFTWHGTQSLVAAARLAALRPLKWPNQAPIPRVDGNSELLRLTLPVLEKAQLMHTDPRGEGFRWYVTVPWHALAIAIAECYVSTDTALVRQIWPLVEASYRQHEATIAPVNGGALRGPLGQLMRRARQKLAAIAPVISGSSNAIGTSLTSRRWSPRSPPVPAGLHIAVDSENPSDCVWPSTFSPSNPDLNASLLPLSSWEQTSPSLEIASSFDVPSTGTSTMPEELELPAWKMWEDLIAGVTFNEFISPDAFFF